MVMISCLQYSPLFTPFSQKLGHALCVKSIPDLTMIKVELFVQSHSSESNYFLYVVTEYGRVSNL